MEHVYTQELAIELDALIMLEDLTPAWKTEFALKDLVKLEQRIIDNGGELTLIHPGGVWIKHVL